MADILIVPNKNFLSSLEEINRNIPRDVCFYEDVLVDLAIDSAFNGWFGHTQDMLQDCFVIGKDLTEENRDELVNLLDNNFVVLTDMLRLSYERYERMFSSYNRIDLLRINWTTKSLVLKLW